MSSRLLALFVALAAASGCTAQWSGRLGGRSSGGSSSGTSSSSSSASSGDGSGDPQYNDERSGWWRRFSIRNVELGMEADKVPGFTCQRTGSDGTGELICVQWLDAKLCRPGACELDGQGATYLHHNYTELGYIKLVGTATDRPRVYRMTYKFQSPDVLAKDSRLGMAMIEKYGEPSEVSGNQFRWSISGISRPELSASCSAGMCGMELNDDGVRIVENRRQEHANLAGQKAAAPPPPVL